MKQVDVLVVGGGLAGLCTARSLARHGYDVLLFEARDRVGGRMASQTLGDGIAVDLGAQWHGPGQDRIITLAAELGVQSYETHTVGRTRYELLGRSGSYRGAAPLRALPAFLGASWGLSKLARLSRQVERERGWQSSFPASLDEQDLGSWITNNVSPQSARHLAGLMFQNLFCREPAAVSLGLALYCMSKWGPFERVLRVEGGAQERQFVGGTQSLLARLSEELAPRIVLARPVRRVDLTGSEASISGDGFETRARRVVIAVPPPLARDIEFTPQLASSRTRGWSRYEMGAVVKCALVYERPFWRDQGLSGEMWSDRGPLAGTYDTSPPDSARGTLVGLAAGPHALRLATSSPRERRELLQSQLVAHFGARAAAPLQYVDRVWSEERWTRGGYSASIPPGAFAEAHSSIRAPMGVVHWAGAETAASWPGYMEGAIESSQRVVQEIVEGQRFLSSSPSQSSASAGSERGRW